MRSSILLMVRTRSAATPRFSSLEAVLSRRSMRQTKGGSLSAKSRLTTLRRAQIPCHRQKGLTRLRTCSRTARSLRVSAPWLNWTARARRSNSFATAASAARLSSASRRGLWHTSPPHYSVRQPCFIDALKFVAQGQRPNHTSMKHAGYAKVLHIGIPAGHLVRNVDPLPYGTLPLVQRHLSFRIGHVLQGGRPSQKSRNALIIFWRSRLTPCRTGPSSPNSGGMILVTIHPQANAKSRLSGWSFG